MRLPLVLQWAGLKKSTIYEQMAREAFPRPIRLTKKAVAWRRADLIGWKGADLAVQLLPQHIDSHGQVGHTGLRRT